MGVSLRVCGRQFHNCDLPMQWSTDKDQNDDLSSFPFITAPPPPEKKKWTQKYIFTKSLLMFCFQSCILKGNAFQLMQLNSNIHVQIKCICLFFLSWLNHSALHLQYLFSFSSICNCSQYIFSSSCSVMVFFFPSFLKFLFFFFKSFSPLSVPSV